MLGKYLEEGGGYQALSATTCATVVPLWGHLVENHRGDDDDNGKNNNDDDDDDDDDIYIMMQCVFVCNEKSSLPPGSLL